MSFAEFQNTIIQKLGLHGMKRVKKLFYRIPISVVRDGVKYDSFVIDKDRFASSFSEVRIHKLLAKFEDVVCSSRGMNQNSQSLAMPGASNSMPISASSFVPIIAPEANLVVSLSFVADINCNYDGRIACYYDGSYSCYDPDLRGRCNTRWDDDNDDVEPTMIADDSDDDIARSISVGVVEHLVRKLSNTPHTFRL
ncbi:hypothetical protein Ahy_A10g048755 [Arachis hypogaea]|uniref:Uncharacterized protein n=1 Tax=Arachis hypogaea TaxID=3818 RepID=A0A445B5T1_ARAHY|nr:hypothetical protein Ahy_A10g048755 [Arachis hypogaea]